MHTDAFSNDVPPTSWSDYGLGARPEAPGNINRPGDNRPPAPLPALMILAIGLGMSFVPITIAATSGVAPEHSGLASGLLNMTQQVGGSLGLAILSTVSTTRIADALHGGAALPVALTHGFKGGFIVAAILCAASAALALVLLPRRKRAVENEQAEAIATSFARCPGAPYCGHLARLGALGRGMRRAAGHS